MSETAQVELRSGGLRSGRACHRPNTKVTPANDATAAATTRRRVRDAASGPRPPSAMPLSAGAGAVPLESARVCMQWS